MKKSWTTILVLLILFGAVVAGSMQTESTPDVLLGAALHQEEVEGEIEEAIATYEQVLAASGVSREQAARAQYRIGICYEKLGRQEAQKAYETVVREYAEQSNLVDLAKARLSVLISENNSKTTIIRKLDISPEVWGEYYPWNISADGRLAGATAYDTGNIAVLDLVTGEGRTVSDYGDWNQEKGFVDEVAISHDGKWLAAWHYKKWRHVWQHPDHPCRWKR